MESQKSNVELLADILADERANTNAVKQEYFTVRAALTEIAQAIQNAGQLEGVSVPPGSRVVDVFQAILGKLRADHEATKVLLIQAAEVIKEPTQ